MKKALFVLVFIVFVLLAWLGIDVYLSKYGTVTVKNDIFSYSELFNIVRMEAGNPFDYTVEQLVSRTEECGNKKDKAYYESLVNKFNSTTKYIYELYSSEEQNPKSYILTVLPNVMNYSSLKEFKEDFDLCAAGGDDYPKAMNNKWLLFESSCGGGGPEISAWCKKIKEEIGPTVKLN